jgi:hypothetical protein
MPLELTQQDGRLLEKSLFSRNFVKALPQSRVPRFGTCAVVGNSPSLKQYNYGKEIDAHDAVLRLNYAPTAGYEQFVGSKTTIRLVNSILPYNFRPFLYKLLLHKHIVLIRDEEMLPVEMYEDAIPRKKMNMSETWNAGKWQVIEKYLTLTREFPDTSIYLLHPVFNYLSIYSLMMYYNGLISMNPASSGFVGILLATFICDYVTTYEIATNDPTSGQALHYYASFSRSVWEYIWPRGGYNSWHPLKSEREMIEKMGKCRPRTTVCDINIQDIVCS